MPTSDDDYGYYASETVEVLVPVRAHHYVNIGMIARVEPISKKTVEQAIKDDLNASVKRLVRLAEHLTTSNLNNKYQQEGILAEAKAILKSYKGPRF